MLRAAASSSSWRRHLKTGKRIAAGTVLASFTAAAYYRPTADNSTDNNGPDRTTETFCSSPQTFPYLRNETPFLVSIARGLSLGVTTLAIRLFMNTYGSYEIENDKEYAHFLKLVLGGDGRSDQKAGLLTIANHRSLFDDPGVMSCVLPLWIGLQPKYQRWGICSQEYCFNDALPAVAKGYIGAGQVLPICRGGGIDQKLLLDFARHLALGEWCHVFPEGGVWQEKELGGRRVRTRKRRKEEEGEEEGDFVVPPAGKLKWGTGKLIAHAPVRPRVIPFAHVGMENLLPVDPETETTVLKKRLFGGEPLRVYVKFGKEIFFDDLIEEHERQHGKLQTFHSSSTSREEEKEEERGNFHRQWDSSEAEKELYHRITSRIETELEKLTREVVVERNPYANTSSIDDEDVVAGKAGMDTTVLKATSRLSNRSGDVGHRIAPKTTLCRRLTEELN